LELLNQLKRLYARLRSDQPQFADRYRAFLDRFTLEEVGAEDDTFDNLRESGVGRRVSL